MLQECSSERELAETSAPDLPTDCEVLHEARAGFQRHVDEAQCGWNPERRG